ncbi:MAG: peptidoglycan DD-metalloendopeptidase family protein [Actinobacteria bacterium]|nr:peptidoglycan DD-metalloendopeptidase family protein [Actinomycetota bacterium]
MEHLAGVVDRIRTIESRIQADLPAGDFSRVLARTGEQSVATLAVAPAFGALGRDTAAAPAGLPLSQMLGRPVAGAAPLPSTLPVAGSAGVATTGPLRLPVAAPMSSGFGPRVHPVTGQYRLHAGIDLAAPAGTPIGAAAAGTVTFAGVRGGYGNLVIVDHGDGTETRYAHQDTIAVTAGQRVGVGDLLGTVGSTGQSTGPHLHLELRRDGQPVDPAPLLGLR